MFQKVFSLTIAGLLIGITPLVVNAEETKDVDSKKDSEYFLERAEFSKELDEMHHDDLKLYVNSLLDIVEPTAVDENNLLVAVEVAVRPVLFENGYGIRDIDTMKNAISKSNYSEETKNSLLNETLADLGSNKETVNEVVNFMLEGDTAFLIVISLAIGVTLFCTMTLLPK